MRNITYRLLFGLVLLAAIAGITILAYNAGVARGEALSAAAPAGQNAGPAYPTYPMPFFWWPFPFFGFGFFGLIAFFFLISITFGAARRLLWGPRWGWHRGQPGYGGWGERGGSEEPPIPPMVAEMHRRMHEAGEGKSAEQGTQKGG